MYINLYLLLNSSTSRAHLRVQLGEALNHYYLENFIVLLIYEVFFSKYVTFKPT